MKTAETIIEEMVDIMPFYMHERAKPYIYDAMKEYAKKVAEQALKDAANGLKSDDFHSIYEHQAAFDFILSTPIQIP